MGGLHEGEEVNTLAPILAPILANSLLLLWAVETIASGLTAWRILTHYPITAACLFLRTGLYLAMANDWYTMGAEHYRMGHLATAWAFRTMTIMMALESVWLMAQGIPSVRRFALASSIVFAGMGVLAAMGTSGLLRGEWIDSTLGSSVGAYRNLAVGCMVYLVANHWLYERARPMGELASRHWRGMVVLVAGMMIGYGMEGWGGRERVWWVVVVGQFVVRGGSLAALGIWGRR